MTTINSELIIDGKILRKNISYIKEKLKNKSKFMAVIKSDAYGHHLENVVKDIDDLSDGYGVVRMDEAKKRLAVLKDCNCKEYNELKQVIDGTKQSKY